MLLLYHKQHEPVTFLTKVSSNIAPGGSLEETNDVMFVYMLTFYRYLYITFPPTCFKPFLRRNKITRAQFYFRTNARLYFIETCGLFSL